MDYRTRYSSLNSEQQRAVSTIDGPVMVIAGPGTGKTELLGMRAAQILRTTDTLPDNILCLTFTDSGADAMRERLLSIIGPAANKVAIHTFHSFGSDVISRYGEYFYQGAQYRPADDLSSYEILRSIFDELDYDNPLASKNNGVYTQIGDTQTAISELKRSGLTSDELLQILDSNDAVIDHIEPQLQEIFSRRVSPSSLAQLIPVAHSIADFSVPSLPPGISPLTNSLSLSLAHAIDDATAGDTTKPITAWKDRWLENDANGKKVFKIRRRQQKLRSLSYVYYQYLQRMQEAELYDFDDMILRVVHAMEVFPDLRFNLQEQYQYIMVDEFQDTNLAQMRILLNLTDNPVLEGKPNLMVVGDDDQAIFSFQGADVSNILDFSRSYPDAVRITLTENYRSGDTILSQSRDVITRGDDRLENHLEDIDKTLHAHQDVENIVQLTELATSNDEYTWIAASIRARLDNGEAPDSIAVLARKHDEIIRLLPYLAEHTIPVSYERRDNVLELEPIKLIEQLSRVLVAIYESKLRELNGLLPELLAHPAWNFAAEDIWKLSRNAYETRTDWFEAMNAFPAFHAYRAWLLDLAQQIPHTPLEQLLDHLTARPDTTADTDSSEQETPPYKSPFFEYFFGDTALEDNADTYISYLEALRSVRSKLREYQPNTTLYLTDFLSFIDLHARLNRPITSVRTSSSSTQSVQLMTAHKSKGLEFDTVYIVNATETQWGIRARSKPSLISYPDNLPLKASGGTADERLRLFFVAMTRAKRQLFMSFAAINDAGKTLDRAGFLLGESWQPTVIEPDSSVQERIRRVEREWYSTLVTPSPSLRTILAPQLESYALSPTHLNSFIDITHGGPQQFLLNNLLHFPQSISPASAYGTAIHAALQNAHTHLQSTGKLRAVEDVLRDFETALKHQRLDDQDTAVYTQRGTHALQAFLADTYGTFTPEQKVELNFSHQNVYIDDAHITGKLDLVDIDQAKKTIVVTDYKTGAASTRWDRGSDQTKIKLHKYKQQLMFYKLLVEQSRDFSAYTVERGRLQFVEPDKTSGAIVALDLEFSDDELQTFRQLITSVWRAITTLSIPDVSTYDATLSGIQAFERDIIDNTI